MTSIMRLLTVEAAKEVDRVCYEFLAEQGYDTANASKSYKVRSKLKKALEERGQVCVFSEIEIKGGRALWFELRTVDNETTIARSKPIKIMFEEQPNDKQDQSGTETIEAS